MPAELAAVERVPGKQPCMKHAFICDAIRTPLGRYGGKPWPPSGTDDLATIPIQALMERNPRGGLGRGG